MEHGHKHNHEDDEPWRAEDWDASWAEHGEDDHSEPDALLVDAVKGRTPGRALELGCGEGHNAVWLATQGWQVTAVDWSQVAVERGQRNAKTREVDVDFIAADVREFRPSGTFDFVTMFYIHLPAEEHADMLRRAADLLSPGGVLFYVGHDRSDPECPVDVEKRVTPGMIAKQLKGLTVVRSEIVERQHTHHMDDMPSRDTIVLARRPPD